MSQTFQPRDVLLIKLALLAATLLAAAAAIAAYKALPPHSGPWSAHQPIPFSHKHHVGDDGIDCRYCHWSVEKSSFAGIPATQVCMSCHSQLYKDAPMLEPLRESARTGAPLRWRQIHKLPGFVYFDHSIHLAKGVACIECHGRVDTMPRIRRVASLEMQWCLGCHRDPGPHLRDPAKVFDMTPAPKLADADREALVRRLHVAGERRLTDCSTCHR